MEENLNQVVPSTSYDWLDQCGHDEDGGNNQVVPVTVIVPLPSSTSVAASIEPFVAAAPDEHVIGSANVVTDNGLSPLQRVGKYAQKSVKMLAVEESLKALSLDGIQVVPSAKSPIMETLAMNVELKTGTSTRKFFRSTSKTTVPNA